MISADPPYVSPRGLLQLYYAVQFGKTMLWVAADLVAFYVLTTVEHLSAQDVALVLMGGLSWHAFSDIVIGQWLERYRGSVRLLATAVGVSVPIASAAFVIALLLAPRWPWAALVVMMVSRSAYALFDVPHHALLGRMARRGWPVVRVVGLRNLWGQVASLALGLGLAPALGPAMSGTCLAMVLGAIAAVAAVSSSPIVILVRRLWNVPAVDTTPDSPIVHRLGAALVGVLALHFSATLLVATTNKVALGSIAPGIALAMLSAGRLGASIPLPAPWRERWIGVKLATSALILIAAVAALFKWSSPVSLFAFGLASGWINILTWAWLGRATDHPRPFGLAVMLTKIGLLASVLVATRI